MRAERCDAICQDCGLVVDEDALDRGHGRRRARDGQTERTGAPLTEARHDRGLSTAIGDDHEIQGGPLSARKRSRLRRLRREHRRAAYSGTGERNLAMGFDEIARIGAALGLADDRREGACRLFRTAQREGILLGRSIEGMAAACVYAAARVERTPVLLADVERVARIDPQNVERAYLKLNRELKLPVAPPSPEQFVPQVASQAGCEAGVRREAEALAAAWTAAYPSKSVHPAGVAAAAVYLASQRHGDCIHQSTVCDVSDVCAPTLRSRRDELCSVA